MCVCVPYSYQSLLCVCVYPIATSHYFVCVCVCVQQTGGSSETRKSSVTDRESLEKRGSTPEPNRRRDTRSGSLSTQNSRSGLEDSYSATDTARKQDTAASLTQNFCPVTLTVNAVFKQVDPPHDCTPLIDPPS